jgi:hypothetical protein
MLVTILATFKEIFHIQIKLLNIGSIHKTICDVSYMSTFCHKNEIQPTLFLSEYMTLFLEGKNYIIYTVQFMLTSMTMSDMDLGALFQIL